MQNVIRLFACLGLVLGGCSNASDTGTYTSPLCASDGTCAGDARCVAGICQDSCGADGAVCPDGAVCREGVCWASASGACSSDADCVAGEACTAGTCTAPPAPITCAADADCPAGARCDGGSCVSRPTPATEICGNGLDDDLDGLVDEECSVCSADADCAAGEMCVRGMCTAVTTDSDGDGHDSAADCDDSDAAVYPGAREACNGIDDNCDGVVDEGCAGPSMCRSDADCASGETCERGVCASVSTPDADGDGYDSATDCNDADASVYPGAIETCDGVDNDCDGTVDEDCGGGMTACSSDSECAAGQACLRGYCFSR